MSYRNISSKFESLWFSIGTTTVWTIGESGFYFQQGQTTTVPRPGLGYSQQLTEWVQQAISAEVKWPGCEAEH
jgi:hypothetical protein